LHCPLRHILAFNFLLSGNDTEIIPVIEMEMQERKNIMMDEEALVN